MRFQKILMMCCVAALISFAGSSAQADFVLAIDDGADGSVEYVVFDDLPLASPVSAKTAVNVGPSTDSDVLIATPGAILLSKSFGVWSITVSTGLSKGTIGSATVPNMDLNVIAASTGAGSLIIGLSDTDFGPVASPATFVSSIGGTTVGTVSSRAEMDWLDQPGGDVSGNQEFSESFGIDLNEPDAIVDQGPFAAAAFSGTASTVASPLFPFSMTEYIHIVHTGAGATSVNHEISISAVPEPASLVMLLTGLPALGGMWMRRRKMQKVS